jgi:hypothetical protein
MTQPSDQPEPRYVICHCRHCDGHIEFDANELATENSIVSCPFCGSKTQLHIPNVEKAVQPDVVRELSPPDRFKSIKVTRGKRVSLTPSQCASGKGQELLALLSEITREGLVSKDGVQRLNTWLNGNGGLEIPAISFLSNIPERLGELTTAKAFEVHFAIERVLPKAIREAVKEKRQEAWLHSPLKPKATQAQLNYIRDLGGKPPPSLNIAEASLLIEELLENSRLVPKQYATENQLQYIRELGGSPLPILTKSHASKLIGELKEGDNSPTPRQIMVLRFWNRLDLANRSRNDVSNWLDNFYAQDSRRKSAWNLYKLQNKDDGTQRDPSWVKIGEGENCLRDLIAWRKKAGLIFLVAVVSILIVVFLIAEFSK